MPFWSTFVLICVTSWTQTGSQNGVKCFPQIIIFVYGVPFCVTVAARGPLWHYLVYNLIPLGCHFVYHLPPFWRIAIFYLVSMGALLINSAMPLWFLSNRSFAGAAEGRHWGRRLLPWCCFLMGPLAGGRRRIVANALVQIATIICEHKNGCTQSCFCANLIACNLGWWP